MIEYEVQGKIAIIKGCSQKEREVILPEEIDGAIVSKIDEYAFCELPNLRRVVIPKTIKVISSYAFASCPKLTEVEIDDGVETIEDWAFSACPIRKLKLPTTLKQMGDYAFMGSECIEQVTEFKKRRTHSIQKRYNKNNCCVFPISMTQPFDTIKEAFINKQADYINAQFDALDGGVMDTTLLDLPMVFDNDQFIIALVSNVALDKFEVEFSNETKEKIGLYRENDEAYINCRLDVLADKRKVATVDFKAPYLEDAVFNILNVEMFKDQDKFCYFFTIGTDFSCYGNGNLSMEFAFNQFDDVYGKYKTELQNELIDTTTYNSIVDYINEKRHNILLNFLKGVTNAPRLLFADKLLEGLNNDEAIDKVKLQEILNKDLDNVYSRLTDFESFKDVCFNVDDLVDAICEGFSLTKEDLYNKYDLELKDTEGDVITEEAIKEYEDTFVNVDENYILHANSLLEVYDALKEINMKFAALSIKA